MLDILKDRSVLLNCTRIHNHPLWRDGNLLGYRLGGRAGSPVPDRLHGIAVLAGVRRSTIEVSGFLCEGLPVGHMLWGVGVGPNLLEDSLLGRSPFRKIILKE